MRHLFVCIALLAACKSPPAPSTFGVNVTLDASSLSSATRNEIVSAALSVTGDETYSRTFDIRSAITSGQVRFRYIPGIQSGTLTLFVDALAPDGTVVGHSSSATVTLSAGHSVAATLTMASGSADDMGSTSDGGDDGGICNPGFHSCAGACVDDRSTDHCGTSCSRCPVTANATAATCDGTSCGVDCQTGYHVCSGLCVSTTDANSCNMSCTPCTPPIGGTASCDGTSCGGSCPSGQKLCFGACIPTGMACNGSCPAGTHECSGNCFDDTSVNSCGTSCTPCPVPANATMATCSAGACGFVCNSGYKMCGSRCIPSTGCCMTSDCAQPANGVATCDTSTNTCVIACNSSYTKCGSECIALTACCTDTDCTPPTNGTASCNASHACVESCSTPYTMACNHACTDTTTDVNNCGACGTVCGGQCALSRCIVTLASGQDSPSGLVVDSTSAYWITFRQCGTGLGGIMKVALAGGTPTAIAPSQNSVASMLAVDSTSAYWIAEDCGGTAPYQIRTVPKTGGNIVNLTNVTAFAGLGFALDSGSIYWTEGAFQAPGHIYSVPKAGGTPNPLATAPDSNPSTLTLDSSYVYWADGGIYKTPIGGGSTTPVSSQGPAYGDPYLALSNGTLYWTSRTGGTVSKVSTSGGAVTDVATGLHSPQYAITDGTNVYFTALNAALSAQVIMRVPISGGTPTTVVSDSASSLAVDGSNLYWISSGNIKKANPK